MIRNMPIRSKLIAILLIPLVVLTVLAFLGIGSAIGRGVQADRVDQETTFAVNLSQLVHELQRERDLSAGWVASDRGYGRVVAQRVAVNQALVDFREDAAALVDFERSDSPFLEHAQLAVEALGGLNDERLRIENGELSVDRTLEFYSEVIDHLIRVDGEIAAATDDRTLVRNVSTFVALARLKEAASQERGFAFAVTSAGAFKPGQFRTFAAMGGAQDTWRAQFDATATAEQADTLDQAFQSGDAQQVDDLREQLLAAGPAGPVEVDPTGWYRYATAKIDLLRGVEQELAADVSAASSTAQSSANRQALLYTLILTIVLWCTVGVALLMSRTMVGPLRRLTRTANEVADQRLPGLVDKLQQSTDLRDLDVVPEPVPVESGDEVGQVSAAFNSVHRVAIQVATEQAALRKSIGDMFLNLARRSQSLIDRQLELIDDLERTEADPDALENLFKLDHLATRMRRNSEDLIVLSGAEPARRWTQPVPLVDVVRAALAEIEDYNRVELLPIDDVGVAGQAVADVVHLLAELIENATSFSPPGTKVQVAGQQVSNGYVLEIEDRGLGMSDEELVEANERLANPPVVDFALSRMLGLYVVARLAQRYRIKVQLRHSWYGGITALVLLPPNVVVRTVMESLEAGPRRGRAELVPSTQPAEPPPAVSGDHLPIFEAARSDWFESGSRGDHLPLRRHAAQQPSGNRAAEPAGNGAGNLASAGGGRVVTPGPGVDGLPAAAPAGPPSAAGPPSPPPWVDPVPPAAPPVTAPGRGQEAPEPVRAEADSATEAPAEPPRMEAAAPSMAKPPAAGPLPTRTPGASVPPMAPPPSPPPTSRRARHERGGGQPPPAPVDMPTPAPSLQTTSVQTTKAGLPRRVPRANLAPGMVAARTAAAVRPADTTGPAGPASSASRSPEEVRSMLSSYRSGLERGRMMAAGEDAVTGSDAPSSARSDDDATQ
jgi:HAMP domain-containing protein